MMRKTAAVFGLMMIIVAFGSMMADTARAERYGPPVDGGDGWYYTDVWNVTNGSYVFTESDFGTNMKINTTLYVDNATVVFKNFTMLDITDMAIDDAVVEFVNTSIVFSNSFTMNGTIKLINTTVTFNVSDYETKNNSAELFYVKNSKLYNFSMTSGRMDITFLNSTIEYQSGLTVAYTYGNFTAKNSKIYTDNISMMSIGTYIVFDEPDPVEYINDEDSINIEDCVIENFTVLTVSQDVVIKDTMFSNKNIYNNDTLLNSTDGKLMSLGMYAMNNSNTLIEGNTFYETLMCSVIMTLNHTVNSTFTFKDNMYHTAMTGIVVTNYDDNYYGNVSVTIDGNVFERLGTNTSHALMLGDGYSPASIALTFDNGTFKYTTITKNEFRNPINALALIGNITEMPVVKHNLMVDYKNAFTLYVNETVDSIDLSDNWWYRTDFDIDNLSYKYVSNMTELKNTMMEGMMNDTIVYDIIANIPLNATTVKPYNEFPLKNITVKLHKGWNLIGLPFMPTKNITEIFNNTDIKVMVFVNGDEYIPVFYQFPIEINFTWTSVYVYADDNTTFAMDNNNTQIVKWELHEGWNLIPYIPNGGRDVFNILNSSGVEVIVVISDNGTYTPFYLNITRTTPEEFTRDFTLGHSMYVYVSSAMTVTIQEYSYYELFEGDPPTF